jgi:hypothetical protein
MESENSEVQLRIVIPKETHIEANPETIVVPKPKTSDLIIIYRNNRHISKTICAFITCIASIIIILVIVLSH